MFLCAIRCAVLAYSPITDFKWLSLNCDNNIVSLSPLMMQLDFPTTLSIHRRRAGRETRYVSAYHFDSDTSSAVGVCNMSYVDPARLQNVRRWWYVEIAAKNFFFLSRKIIGHSARSESVRYYYLIVLIKLLSWSVLRANMKDKVS